MKPTTAGARELVDIEMTRHKWIVKESSDELHRALDKKRHELQSNILRGAIVGAPAMED